MKGKKLAAIALSALLVIGGSSMAVACNNQENPDDGGSTVVTPERTLSSIVITTPPEKTEYVEGESFDKTGMVVTANYSDNTSEQITDYTVDKTTLAVGDTSVTVTYQGKTATQAITVKEAVTVLLALKAADGDTLNIYSDNTFILMEGSEYSTTFEWTLDDKGLIKPIMPAGIEGYVTINVYRSAGKVCLDVLQTYGPTMYYSCTFEEYAQVFDIKVSEAGRVEVGDDVFVVMDDGSYTLTVEGKTSEGYVVYTTEHEITNSQGNPENVPALILQPDDATSEADYLIAAAPYNVFSLTVGDTTFSIPESRYLHWTGNTVCGYANEGCDLEIYFYPDSTAAIDVTNSSGVVTEYGYKYTTFSFDKNDEVDPLKITCAATNGLTVSYDDADYEYTFTFVEKILDFANSDFSTGKIVYKDGDTHTLVVDATEINKLLADFTPAQELASYKATSAEKANGDAANAEAFSLVFYKGGKLSIMLDSGYSETVLGEGQWQAEGGVGGMYSGSYVEFGFFGDSEGKLTVTVTTSGIQSAAKIVFEFDEEEFAELYEILSA
ncbi:MAG: bacterial Ig-like domain-containing protein [Candidatus Coproplasma sp.]